jgi:ferredoxin-type protein NapH
MGARRLRASDLAAPGVVATAGGALLAVAILAGSPMSTPLVIGYIGGSIAAAIMLYVALPRADRTMGRRLALLLVGIALFGTAALRDPGARLFQIEGLFFDILDGVLYAAVAHYLIAKVVGPLIFGRIWCGWACWTAMVLDMLPFRRSPGRLPGRWGLLRYAHFAISLGLVALLWMALGYRIGPGGAPAIAWFLAGNALYYALGIGLALALRDNRAFCKYACPVAVPLKLGAPLALLKIQTDASRCNRHEECEAICPMDIDITGYIARGERIGSSECILCQACINVCPEQALSLSLGVEGRPPDLLRTRGPRGAIIQDHHGPSEPYQPPRER